MRVPTHFPFKYLHSTDRQLSVRYCVSSEATDNNLCVYVAVVLSRYDRNTPSLPGENFPHRHYRGSERHEYNSRPCTVDE